MAYRLTLTDDDVSTIAFVGGRYCWSEALQNLKAGENEISEPEAWAIRDAFEMDCEGCHSPFPMLDGRSQLAEKLFTLWDSIV